MQIKKSAPMRRKFVILLLLAAIIPLNPSPIGRDKEVKELIPVIRLPVHTTHKAKSPLSEGFEEGVIPYNWTVFDLDNDGHQWITSVFDPHTGTYSADIIFNADGNDDWLITPKLIVSFGDTFSFWARSRNASLLEDFQVLVSITTAFPDSFHDTLATVIGVPVNYTYYTYNLSAFAGQDVYLAIRCISVDKLHLYVDDVIGPELYLPACDVAAYNPSFNPSWIMMNYPDTVGIWVKNVGTAAQTNIPVYIEADDGFSDNTTISSLSPDDSAYVEFIWSPALEDTHWVSLFTALNGDEVSRNDTTKVLVCIHPFHYGTIFTEDFESGVFPPIGWSIDSLYHGTGTWHLNEFSCHSPSHSAALAWVYYDQDEWIKTPEIYIPADYGRYTLNFYYNGYNGSPYGDHYYVFASTDGGTSWPYTLYDLSALTPEGFNYFETPVELDLSRFAGDSVMIAWNAVATGGLYFNWYIDDIEIYGEGDDVSLDSILSPSGPISAGDDITPSCLVVNDGKTTIDSFFVYLSVDTLTVVVHSDSVKLFENDFVNDTATAVFNIWTIGDYGNVQPTWTFCTAWDKDIDASNDTVSKVFNYTGVGRKIPIGFSASLVSNLISGKLEIDFALPAFENVRISIYDQLGRRVKILINRNLGAGYYRAVWNGRTDTGTSPTGVYFYCIEAGKCRKSEKFVFIR